MRPRPVLHRAQHRPLTLWWSAAVPAAIVTAWDSVVHVFRAPFFLRNCNSVFKRLNKHKQEKRSSIKDNRLIFNRPWTEQIKSLAIGLPEIGGAYSGTRVLLPGTVFFLYFSSTADTSRQRWRNTHRWAVQLSGCIMGIPVLSIDTFRFDFLLADVIVCAVDKQIWPFRQKNTSLFRSVGGEDGTWNGEPHQCFPSIQRIIVRLTQREQFKSAWNCELLHYWLRHYQTNWALL